MVVFSLFLLSPHYIRWKNRNSLMCIKGNRKKVLMCLSNYDYRRPSEISRECGICINTVSNVLALLKKEGYVVCINEDYYRSRLYRLTKEGKKKIR